MRGRSHDPQRLSMLPCMVQILLIGVIVVVGIFWLIGGHEWLTLTLIPVPTERQYDEIISPPDNPGWRRTIGVAMPADEVRDYFLQTLRKQGWKIEPLTRTSSVVIDSCLKGDHVFFSTIYIEIFNLTEGGKYVGESSIFIRVNPELTRC
jgi:hypothetical protein